MHFEDTPIRFIEELVVEFEKEKSRMRVRDHQDSMVLYGISIFSSFKFGTQCHTSYDSK